MPRLRSGSVKAPRLPVRAPRRKRKPSKNSGPPRFGTVQKQPEAVAAQRRLGPTRPKAAGAGSPRSEGPRARGNAAGTKSGDTSTGVPNAPTGGATGDPAAEETLRVHISAAEMEKIWDGQTQQTWEDVVPVADMEKDTKAAEPKEPSECGAMPVARITRFDGSGTTFNFKAYLSLLPGAPNGLWTEAP